MARRNERKGKTKKNNNRRKIKNLLFNVTVVTVKCIELKLLYFCFRFFILRIFSEVSHVLRHRKPPQKRRKKNVQKSAAASYYSCFNRLLLRSWSAHDSSLFGFSGSVTSLAAPGCSSAHVVWCVGRCSSSCTSTGTLRQSS